MAPIVYIHSPNRILFCDTLLLLLLYLSFIYLTDFYMYTDRVSAMKI